MISFLNRILGDRYRKSSTDSVVPPLFFPTNRRGDRINKRVRSLDERACQKRGRPGGKASFSNRYGQGDQFLQV